MGRVPATLLGAIVAAVLVMTGCDEEPADRTNGNDTTPGDCPAPPDDVTGTDELDEPDDDLPGEVPEGASSARMCPGGGSTMLMPADVLAEEVDDLVATVNGLGEQDTSDGYSCTSDAGPGYRIQFDYPDGSTFLISAGFYGCDSVIVGDGYRDGPDVVVNEFYALVAAQREGQKPPKPPVKADLDCQGAGYSAPGVRPLGSPPEGVIDAVLCRVESNGVFVTYSAPIDATDLRFLREDLATHQSTGTLRCSVPEPHPWLVGTTAWGDRVEIYSECGTGWWRLPNGNAWTPSPKAVAILDRLVSETRRDR